MRISYNWLKDYIDIKLPPEKIAEILTMAGLAVDALQKTASGALLEIEVTANRPDWLSYVGVARELSALTGAKLKLPSRHCEPRRGEAIPLLEIASDASHPRNDGRNNHFARNNNTSRATSRSSNGSTLSLMI